MDIDLVKSIGDIGAVGLMFLAYFILHRGTFQMLQDMMRSMNANYSSALQEQKATVHAVTETFDRLASRQREAEERNYEILKSLAEDIKVLVAGVGRVEMKVDNLESHLDRRFSK